VPQRLSADRGKSFGRAILAQRWNRPYPGPPYGKVISDVGRDDEGPGSDLKGVDLADAVFSSSGLQILLFTARFNPSTFPGATDAE
jgi:hypothetical protein